MQRTQVPCVLECRGAKFSGQVQYPLDAAQKRSIQAAQQNTQQHPAYLGRITLPQSPPSLDCCVQARFHWVWFYSQRVVYKDTVHVALPALAQHSPRRGRRSDDRQRTLAPQSPGRVRDRRLPTRFVCSIRMRSIQSLLSTHAMRVWISVADSLQYPVQKCSSLDSAVLSAFCCAQVNCFCAQFHYGSIVSQRELPCAHCMVPECGGMDGILKFRMRSDFHRLQTRCI